MCLVCVAAVTLTASKMRMALARSFNLRHALRAASRILGSGTRSYPMRVFMPARQEIHIKCKDGTNDRNVCL